MLAQVTHRGSSMDGERIPDWMSEDSAHHHWVLPTCDVTLTDNLLSLGSVSLSANRWLRVFLSAKTFYQLTPLLILKITTNTECLLCVRLLADIVMVHSTNLLFTLSSLYRWRNWDTGKLSNLLTAIHSQDSNSGELTPELCSPPHCTASYESETQKSRPAVSPTSPHACKRFLALLLHLLRLWKEAKDVFQLVSMRSDCTCWNIRCSLQTLIRLPNEFCLLLLTVKKTGFCLWFLVGRLNPGNFPGNMNVCYLWVP